MTDVRVTTADGDGEREDAFAVRRVVFVDEQDVDERLEWDDWDDADETTHFVAYAGVDDATDDDASEGGEAGERPVGAARLRPKDPDVGAVGKVERVAVLAEARESGAGRALMNALEALGRDRGFEQFLLHSQTHAAGFYERLGYDRFGDEFDEAGIPHVKMRKDA
jgi:predicted GNAT family N-acyltransferase